MKLTLMIWHSISCAQKSSPCCHRLTDHHHRAMQLRSDDSIAAVDHRQ